MVFDDVTIGIKSKFQSNNKKLFETFLFQFEIGDNNEKKSLRDPTCDDVTCISSIIQDGGHFIACSKNISKIKQDMKNL